MLRGNFTRIRVSHQKILGDLLQLAESPLNTSLWAVQGWLRTWPFAGEVAEPLPAGATRARKPASAHTEPGDLSSDCMG